MIVPDEALGEYLGKDTARLEGRVGASTLKKLDRYDAYTRSQLGLPVIDYLFLAHQRGNKSLRALAGEIGIDNRTLRRIFDFYELPAVGQAEAARRQWKDPGFRERNAEGIKSLWQVPQHKEKMAQRMKTQLLDPEYKEKLAVGLHRYWQDPVHRAERAETMRKIRDSPKMREKMGSATREELVRRWQDPGFRERQAERLRSLWQDPDYREKMTKAWRGARRDPQTRERWKLPTLQGYRSDIGFYAQSAWEANIARVLLYCSREFSTRQPFTLTVPERLRHLYRSAEIETTIDFRVRDPRGNFVLYEIMAHPLESPDGYAKLELLVQQIPGVDLRIVGERFYSRLKERFEAKINSCSYLHGWETGRDNLKTNPKKYQ